MIEVDGSGFTQPVSGTVTANLSATDNAVLDAIAASDASIDGKITACNTGAVVVSSGSITANLSATDNAVLDAIATSVANALSAQTQAPVVVQAKTATSVLAGDVETVVNMNAGAYRTNQITVQGRTTSNAYSFILEFSTDGTNFFSDGVQPELYNAGGGTYTFSLTRDPVLCQYVRVLHLTDGDDLTMDIITARR